MSPLDIPGTTHSSSNPTGIFPKSHTLSATVNAPGRDPDLHPVGPAENPAHQTELLSELSSVWKKTGWLLPTTCSQARAFHQIPPDKWIALTLGRLISWCTFPPLHFHSSKKGKWNLCAHRFRWRENHLQQRHAPGSHQANESWKMPGAVKQHFRWKE